MTGLDVLTLVSETFTVDELSQRIPTPTEREVFCEIKSISQSEFFEAARIGLTPAYKAVLSTSFDYAGEDIAVYDGQRYAIYRTYKTESGQMELYLKRETGVR